MIYIFLINIFRPIPGMHTINKTLNFFSDEIIFRSCPIIICDLRKAIILRVFIFFVPPTFFPEEYS